MRFDRICLAALLALVLASPAAAQQPPTKIDLALTESLNAGCATQSVIIRTKPGYRAGLAQALQEHGDLVATEHPSIDAVSAQVHCDDLDTLNAFAEVVSISINAQVLPADNGKAKNERTLPPQARGKGNNGKRPSTLERPAKARDTFAIERAGTRGRHGVGANKPRDDEGQQAAAAQSYLFETLGLKLDATAYSPAYSAAVSGAGIGVAIIDSGIEPSPDFDNRITHFYDFTTGRPRAARPRDGYGHGTHIAGLIGSRYVGVAPNARLVGLRVLNNAGQGRTSDVIAAIEFATANRAALGISVLNISLGHPVYEPAETDPLVQAVEAAVRSGLVVITAAGNFGINPATGQPGYAGVMSPGNAPSAITVGALQTFETARRGDDQVAPYSSRGPSWYDAYAKPDVVAPGHNMLSLAAKNSQLRIAHEQQGGRGSYMRLSGTSMAAAVTSGLAALVLKTNPGLTSNALKATLQFTAIPAHDAATGSPFDALAQGTGGINGQGALDLAGAIDSTRRYGQPWLTVGLQTYSVIAGEPHNWAGSIIWGGHRVLGEGVVALNQPVWHRNIVWGTFMDEGDNIVWGTWFEEDNIVWGTFFGEGDNIVWGTSLIWAESDNIVWGTSFEEDNIVWGTNIVWGSAMLGLDVGDNIVWGTSEEWDNIVWGTWFEEDNIVWGTLYDFNIVWGSSRRLDLDGGDNIVWGTWTRDSEGDNIVWGTSRGLFEEDNIVWGTSMMWGDTYIVTTSGNGRAAGR